MQWASFGHEARAVGLVSMSGAARALVDVAIAADADGAARPCCRDRDAEASSGLLMACECRTLIEINARARHVRQDCRAAMDSSTSISIRWDRGTWIAALDYVERFGSTAVTAAGLHMLETVDTDDLQERARRARVALAVAELQRGDRRDGEPVH